MASNGLELAYMFQLFSFLSLSQVFKGGWTLNMAVVKTSPRNVV